MELKGGKKKASVASLVQPSAPTCNVSKTTYSCGDHPFATEKAITLADRSEYKLLFRAVELPQDSFAQI